MTRIIMWAVLSCCILSGVVMAGPLKKEKPHFKPSSTRVLYEDSKLLLLQKTA